jgi:hypothetical protein
MTLSKFQEDMKEFEVGHLVYLVVHSGLKIIPVRILEKTYKKTLKGEEISFFFETKFEDIRSRESSLNVKGLFFKSLEEAKNYAVSLAISAVEKNVKTASQQAQENFPDLFRTGPVQSAREFLGSEQFSEDTAESASEKIVLVDLGDGRTARAKLP